MEHARCRVRVLLAQSKKVFFVTNNATKSRAGNVTKLTSLGIKSTLVSRVLAACVAPLAGFALHGFSAAYGELRGG